MNHLPFLLLLSLLSSSSFAAAPDWVLAAPSAEAWPLDDGIIVRQDQSLSLSESGLVAIHVETALRPFTEYISAHRMLDPRLNWNDARSSLDVERARTWMLDGTEVDAVANSFVPNTAPELEWAVPYAHMRQMVIAHVGVENGSTSELAWTRRDRQPTGVPFWGVMDLQAMLPIVDQTLKLEVPPGIPLQIGAIHLALGQDATVSPGSWMLHRNNVPPANLAELGAGRANLQRLAWSSMGSWSETRAWLESRILPAVTAGPQIQAAMMEILKGAGPDAERIGRIHKFVVEGIRNVEWPVADFDYAVRPAEDVFRSGVGHSLDKAVLLAAMLKEAGFSPEIAMTANTLDIAPQVAAAPQLDQIWVMVPLWDGRFLWLDPFVSADQRNGSDLCGASVLLLSGQGTLTELEPCSAEQNHGRLRVVVDLGVEGDALTVGGKADLDLVGGYDPVVAFDRNDERQKGLAGKVAKGLGGAKVDSVSVANQSPDALSLGAAFTGGSIPIPDNGLVTVALPGLPGALDAATLQIYRETRTLPLDLGAPAREEREITLNLPPGWEIVWSPGDLDVQGNVGRFVRKVVREEGSITLTTRLEVGAARVQPAQYGDFKALIDARDAGRANVVVLRKGKK